MKRLILIIVLNVIAITLYSQDLINEDRDNFLNELKVVKSDSAKMDLLLDLAQYYIIPIYDHPANSDTAFLLINQVENLNSKIKSKAVFSHILILKSYYLRTSDKKEEGKRIILTAISLLKKTSQNELLGQAYYELSNYYDYDFKINTIDQRIAYIDTAILAFVKSNSFNDLGNSYKVLADLDHLSNQYVRAFTEIRKSLEYYKITGYKRLEGVYDLISQLNFARGDYKQALSYEFLALKTTNDNKDYESQLCEIENNLALTFYTLKDMKPALVHYEKALEVAKKEQDVETIYGLAAHVVATYIQLSKPQEALNFLKSIEKNYAIPKTDKLGTEGYMYKTYLGLYTVLKQYNIAKYYCNQLISKNIKTGVDVFRLSEYYYEIIKYFIAIKDYSNGLKYLNENRELLQRIHDNLGLASNYTLWFSLDTAQGKFKPAVYDLLKANLINDTILNADKMKSIKELELQYETGEKEGQINFLNQKSLLEEKNMQQEKKAKNYAIAGVVLALIIAALLFMQNLMRKRSNKIISDKNELLRNLVDEKEWLVKEIHHRVKNNLHTIICLMESQAAYLDNDALSAIQKSQHRIYAMSLIHQKLYQTDDLKVISMKIYVIEFIQYLVESYGAPKNVKVITDVDDISLGVAQAIPLGLIVNEAVSNSFKYAFPNNRKGEISILLNSIDQRLFLTISDDGIGSPKKPGDNLNSLGLELINGLVIDLHANILFENNSGTIIKLDFLIDPISTTLETSGSFLKTTV